jgi:hypothetical protein
MVLRFKISLGKNETIHMLLAPPVLPAPHIKVYVLKDYLKEKLGISLKTRMA